MKRKPKYRYGVDVVCDRCFNGLMPSVKYGWLACARDFRHYKKNEEDVPESSWRWHGIESAKAWAKVRDACECPPFPAGLELFLIEILNDRS